MSATPTGKSIIVTCINLEQANATAKVAKASGCTFSVLQDGQKFVVFIVGTAGQVEACIDAGHEVPELW
jgi:hypothetical protein